MSRNPDLLDRLIESFSIRGLLLHQATLFLVATGTLIVGAIVLWGQNRDRIAELNEFQLTEDKVRITSQPEWMAPDVRQLLLSEIGKNPSILDSTLVPKTADLIKNIGYIERVQKIEKSKSGLDIDVVYRRPVAFVEISAITMLDLWPKEKAGKSVLLLVDRNGIVMPDDATPSHELPMISVLYPARLESLNDWIDWPDERIKDAAAIVDLFADSSAQMGINRVVTTRKPDAPANHTLPYELWSEWGARILWGSAPGAEQDGEADAQQKLRLIQQLVKEHGSLDEMQKVEIDVRSGSVIIVGESKTASREELFSSQK